jgi:2-oxo-4-hydroxy-4-carboxy-5-ureidoimidazoline decarboxylase
MPSPSGAVREATFPSVNLFRAVRVFSGLSAAGGGSQCHVFRYNHTPLMGDGLARLNDLSADAARAELLACCGASRWAQEMTARRPFVNSAELFAAADAIWHNLGRQDWLEAFASHPQIGEDRAKKEIDSATGRQLARHWSAEEQSGTQGSTSEVMRKLAQGNRAYRERFGYVFIVCATGKTASEMLAILKRRVQNDAATELDVAAEEQRLIARLRLEKLVAR